MRKLKIVALIVGGLLFQHMATAQCCGGFGGSAGTSGARFGMNATGAGNMRFQLVYDMNYMNRLYEGTRQVSENDAERVVHTGILGASYGISRNFMVSGMMTYIGMEMASTWLDGRRYVNYLYGFGDMFLMARYRFMNPLAWNGWEVSAGAGPKLPTGSFTTSGSQDIGIPIESQLATGSFDGVFWIGFSRSHILFPNLNLSSGTTFRLAGRNRNYTPGETYNFGNEFQSTAGLGYSLYAGKRGIDIFSFLIYRSQEPDRLEGLELNMTGGSYLYLSPGLNLNSTGDLSMFVSADIPLYRNLNGPQLTTSFRVSAGVMYNLDLGKSAGQIPGF